MIMSCVYRALLMEDQCTYNGLLPPPISSCAIMERVCGVSLPGLHCFIAVQGDQENSINVSRGC